LAGGNISRVTGNFESIGAGLINIKREEALDFLRKYLEAASYKALVDSFSNYEYNKGRISVDTQKGSLAVGINLYRKKPEKEISISICTIF